VAVYHYGIPSPISVFDAFPQGPTCGVSVAAGKINFPGNQFQDEIVAGTLTGNEVRVYRFYGNDVTDLNHPVLMTAANPYGGGYQGGVTVATGRNVNRQDGVIVGTSPGSYADVKVAYYTGILDFAHPAVEFWPYTLDHPDPNDPNFTDPPWPGPPCGDNAAYSEVFGYFIIADGPGYPTDFRYFDPNGNYLHYRATIYSVPGNGGAFVAY
jgi:hypothetical protein